MAGKRIKRLDLYGGARIARLTKQRNALRRALGEVVQIEWDQDPESRNVHDETLEQYERLIARCGGPKAPDRRVRCLTCKAETSGDFCSPECQKKFRPGGQE